MVVEKYIKFKTVDIINDIDQNVSPEDQYSKYVINSKGKKVKRKKVNLLNIADNVELAKLYLFDMYKEAKKIETQIEKAAPEVIQKYAKDANINSKDKLVLIDKGKTMREINDIIFTTFVLYDRQMGEPFEVTEKKYKKYIKPYIGNKKLVTAVAIFFRIVTFILKAFTIILLIAGAYSTYKIVKDVNEANERQKQN